MQQVALGGLEKQGELKGMDEAVFSAAPPEAMRGLLQVGSGTNRAGQRLGKRRLRSFRLLTGAGCLLRTPGHKYCTLLNAR